MRVSLNVVAGPQTGRAFTFDQHDTFMIGRSEDSQFCLPQDRFFSRNHCLIEIAPPRAFLRDLGSTNGTYVNDIRVETAHLKSGDRILIVDDLIATGGTAEAAVKLITRVNGIIVGATFVIDLPELGGMKLLKSHGVDSHALVTFDGH